MIRQVIYREALYQLRVVAGWCEAKGMERASRVLHVAYWRVLDKILKEKR